MSNENTCRKAKPRPARRGFTNCFPANQVASLLYTTGPASANLSTPLWPAVLDSTAHSLSGLWRWLP